MMRRYSSTGVSKIGAGADHDGIDAAEEIRRRRGHALHVRGDGRVSGGIAGLAQRLQPRSRLAQDRFAPPREEHRGALARHRLGAGQADAGSAAIDQGLLACEPAAQFVPRLCFARAAMSARGLDRPEERLGQARDVDLGGEKGAALRVAAVRCLATGHEQGAQVLAAQAA